MSKFISFKLIGILNTLHVIFVLINMLVIIVLLFIVLIVLMFCCCHADFQFSFVLSLEVKFQINVQLVFELIRNVVVVVVASCQVILYCKVSSIENIIVIFYNMNRKIIQSKSVDETKSSEKKVIAPKKQASVSEPLQNARMSFLQSHIDMDTSYNFSTLNSKSNMCLSNDSYSGNADGKDSQCTRTEKGLLKRFMHVR